MIRTALRAGDFFEGVYPVEDGEHAGDFEERRAIIEQAKGILMARNSIDADAAHQLLKTHSQRTGTKLNDVAQAITEAHLLLVRI